MKFSYDISQVLYFILEFFPRFSRVFPGISPRISMGIFLRFSLKFLPGLFNSFFFWFSEEFIPKFIPDVFAKALLGSLTDFFLRVSSTLSSRNYRELATTVFPGLFPNESSGITLEVPFEILPEFILEDSSQC